MEGRKQGRTGPAARREVCRRDPRGVALVTGASRGLGAAISRHLAGAGWSVAVNYRSGAEAAEGVVDEIRAAGHDAAAFAADITAEDQVTQLVDQVTARFGAGRGTGHERHRAAARRRDRGPHLADAPGPAAVLRQEPHPAAAGGTSRHEGPGPRPGHPHRSDSVARAQPLRSAYVAAKAATVGFLASDAAAFITGQQIAVNGGHTIT